MQSQQKRVKWSRGETAEALEERTDTGITSVSVELMENCIPDIYGNISRRPAIKPLPIGANYPGSVLGFAYDSHLQVIPFYITETDYILIGVHYSSAVEFIRIRDGVVVAYGIGDNSVCPHTGAIVKVEGTTYTYGYKPVSYAQQNNYMLIADTYNVYKIQVSNFETTDGSLTITCGLHKFSAGWCAPDGTQTKEVSNLNITGLQFSGHFYNYIKTDNTQNTTIYSYTTTNLTYSSLERIEKEIPVGSIIQMPNIGCYFRVEGYDITGGNLKFPDIVFDGVLNPDDSVPSTGTYCKANPGGGSILTGTLTVYINGVQSETLWTFLDLGINRVRNANALHGVSETTLYYDDWSNMFLCTQWANTSESDVKITAYGALLTPVADENATDSKVNVEYGYKSLQPSSWGTSSSFPHPKKLLFLQQRLWAGAWTFNFTQEYAIVVGSQIGRYNDFKNDYNQENEPITLDILTQFKENILHLVDYNGLKIMTDSYEYAYDASGGVVKQSANGSLETCDPIIFDSLCLYVDGTGKQVKAMQYEFQSNIFNSSTINQLAPHDLVWRPIFMGTYEDKVNSTGKYLFLVNEESTSNPRLAVCNFVPSNQANIWSRWSFAPVEYEYDSHTTYNRPFIHSLVNLKNGVVFLICAHGRYGTTQEPRIIPAVIDFDANADCESSVLNISGTNYFAPVYKNVSPYTQRVVYGNATVAVYSNGVFQWLDTTTSTGALTKDISGLTNVTVGLPINSTIVSHPIDVGGKTKSIKKRIGKTVMSVHGTEPGAITINGKTGYMNPAKDSISFYGVTGMKNEIKYTITNNNGAMFHLESLLMNIEYGTLNS